ncbi:hypothetical protein ACFXHA_35990 [Nocardia sp. NPDC059240]|uniref:hypothetical protein n=1 Tax=Nocardia sp. NPDC059240 TaxID=3346786 RepID=UPI0036889A12
MTTTHPRPGHPDENLGEFAEELRLLAEAVLERVEPVLRRTASDGRTEWNSCSWCPVCAAAAIVRGEHHDVVAAIAEHGTAIVTVLREALAGVPVDPVIPPELDPDSPEYHAWHQYAHAAANPSEATDLPFADESAPTGHAPSPAASLAAVFTRFLAGAQGRAAARNQHGDNDFGAPAEDTEDPLGHGPGAARRPTDTQSEADPAADPRPFGPPIATPTDDPSGRATGAPAAGSSDAQATGPASGRASRPGGGRRAKYVPIDVTIKA